MNETKTERQREIEIDFQRLIKEVWKKLWLCILISVMCAVVALVGTFYFITPMYQSSAMFYVNNNSFALGDTSVSITSSDITASKSLVQSYIVILETRETINDVIDYAGVDRTYQEVKEMIGAASVNATEIFQVVVTGPDPVEAEQIADAIAYILPKRISSIIEGTSAKIVDSAIVPSRPSSPSYSGNAIIGFMIGFILSVGYIVLWEIFDVTIRTEDDITATIKHPILASVPDMTSHSREGYYYGSRSSTKEKRSALSGKKQVVTIGKDISFAAMEAYKLLRTKLQFSFADNNDCHVIGVSSAMAGEGKSTSAVNLAYSLAQLDNRVLLIDCDLRRPSIHTKISVDQIPGLTNFLTRQCVISDIIQYCKIDDVTFNVICAGRIPPNPIELLSSDRMQATLGALKKSFNYIILDLPPVDEVSDALVAAKATDGILLVVRQNYGNRIALESTVRQFEFINARILGIVISCSKENHGHYGGTYKKYYGSYARSYTAAYKHGAEHAEKERKQNEE